MNQPSTRLSVSHSGSNSFTGEYYYDSADVHFKWASIRNFIYLSFVFASCSNNFDIYSRVIFDHYQIYVHLIAHFTIGMSYCFYNEFVKKYTRNLNFNDINPLLRGISFGILVQNGFWAIVHSQHLTDSLIFFVAQLSSEVDYTLCRYENITCVPTKQIVQKCKNESQTNINVSSVHLNYFNSPFGSGQGGSVITTKLFTSAMTWTFIFFLSSGAEKTVLKICKLAFTWKCVTTTVIVIMLLFNEACEVRHALQEMLSLRDSQYFVIPMDYVSYTFGIGQIGICDFGSMSPFTMVDNAVVIFTLIFTILSFTTSFVVRILYIFLIKCVKINHVTITPHYLLFVVIPLSAEFLQANKIYTMYVYLNMIFTLTAYLALVTLTMSRILCIEFSSVKKIYFVATICFLGFIGTLPVGRTSKSLKGLIYGFNFNLLYLGTLKTIIIMWFYGVKTFCIDVRFWLGFKPTKFWTTCWTFSPFITTASIIEKVVCLGDLFHREGKMFAVAVAFISFTIILVLIFHIRLAVKLLSSNTFFGTLFGSKKYGPLDFLDRKKRRFFDEIEEHRKCYHGCIILDDVIDCNHLPVLSRSRLKRDEDNSFTHIYEADTTRRVDASEMNLLQT